jgi:hypothetical protein
MSFESPFDADFVIAFVADDLREATREVDASTRSSRFRLSGLAPSADVRCPDARDGVGAVAGAG